MDATIVVERKGREDVADDLIDFHGADKSIDGPEQQVRGRVGIGGEASDLEAEQGYLTLEVFEIDGVRQGVLLFLGEVG